MSGRGRGRGSGRGRGRGSNRGHDPSFKFIGKVVSIKNSMQ